MASLEAVYEVTCNLLQSHKRLYAAFHTCSTAFPPVFSDAVALAGGVGCGFKHGGFGWDFNPLVLHEIRFFVCVC